jgi:hypothetical protein
LAEQFGVPWFNIAAGAAMAAKLWPRTMSE